MRLVPDLDSHGTRSRTAVPYAVADRIRSRARGCWPGALDARCTPYEQRVMPRSARICAEPRWFLHRCRSWLAAPADRDGTPRWWVIAYCVIAAACIVIGAYLVTAGTLDAYGTRP